MANKWRDEVEDENLRLVQMVIDSSIIAHSVNIEVLSDDDANEPVTSTIENSRVTKLTGGENDGVEVTIILNELILNQFPQDFQILAIEEAMHGIHRNKNDKVVRDNEDAFNSYLGFLQKVGTEKFVVYKESVRSAKRALDNGNIPDKRQISMNFEKKMNNIIDVDDNVKSISITSNDKEIKFKGSYDKK